MRLLPSPWRGWAGLTISGAVSSSLKMRSQAAMAACRMLYLSLRSWIGRQKRCEYMLKLASMPMVTEPGQHAESAAPDHERNGDGREQLDRRVVERVGEDRVLERDHVQAVDGLKVLVGALFAIEELHDASCR